MRKKFNLREAMNFVHRWTGLAIALFLVIVGLTGSILTFRSQVDALFNPGLHVKPAPGQQVLSLATLAQRAEAEQPHGRLGFFTVEKDQAIFHLTPRTNPATGQPYKGEEFHLALNPYTGEGLHCGPESNPGRACWNVTDFVYSLHTSLTTGTTFGWNFVGAVALIWTIDCFVAFVLTFPRGSGPFWIRWKQAWRVKWRASFTRVNFDLHRASGLWLWPLLFIFAWSSVMLGLRDVYDPVMKHIFPYITTKEEITARMAPQPVEHPKLSWLEAEGIGARLMSEQAASHHFTVERPYGMGYVPAYGSYIYGVRSSVDLRAHGWDTSVSIDGNTGQLRSFDMPRGQHLGNTISTLLWGIHYADLRDWTPFRILICLFGVLLTVLASTGVIIWWRKRGAGTALSHSHLPLGCAAHRARFHRRAHLVAQTSGTQPVPSHSCRCHTIALACSGASGLCQRSGDSFKRTSNTKGKSS